VALGDNWKVDTILSVNVNSNEFTGRFLILNRIPFRIVSHDAGTTVSFVVSSPLTLPNKKPEEGSLKLFRKPSGEEARPLSWSKRIAVIPTREQSVYQYILETGRLLSEPNSVLGLADISYEITPEGANTRCWLGVSAADNEPYVIDQLALPDTYSPRPGNEGAIVSASVSARYSGRPVFTPPPPLEDVLVAILDEARSDELLLNILPNVLMPFLEPHNRLRIERISGTDLISLLNIDETSIQLSDAKNPELVTDWTLNPAVEAELRAVYASNNKPVPTKFIWAIAKKNDINLDILWKQATPEPVLCTEPFIDRLSNRAERYIYRAKLVNAIGMPSNQSAYFPNVWRAPDKTMPAGVIVSSIDLLTEDADEISLSPIIKMDASVAANIKGVLVFAGSFPSTDTLTDDDLNRAALLKIPNRPDFMSEQLYRIRASNKLIEPSFVPISSSETETNNGVVTLAWKNIGLNFSYENNVVVWAASVSNDNMLSPLSGYKKKFTGLIPPEIPGLMMSSNSEGLELSFTPVSVDGFFYRLEKSTEGPNRRFELISSWFKPIGGTNTEEYHCLL